MEVRKKLSVIFLLLILISISIINVSAANYSVDDINKRIDRLLEYEYNYTKTNSLEGFVSNHLAKNAGTSESDWFIISLNRNGNSFNSNSYTDNLNNVILNIYKSGVNNAKFSDLQRIALAYTACNKDIRNIEGNNLLADCTYNRELSRLSSQGIMTLDYALILLDSKNFYVPKNSVTTRDDIVSKILSLQLDNGGFSLTGTAPDADVTAMTITALAPYIKNNITVNEAVDRALNRLSIMQKADGSFASYGKLNCESTAQVIVMLTSLGINPENDDRFIKNGCSAIDAMLTYQTEKGGFKHLQNGNENQMAAYQAFYALVAYKSFISTSQGLYNFTDETNPQQTVTDPNPNSESDKSNLGSQNNNINLNNNNGNSASSYVYGGNDETPNNHNNISSQNNTSGQASKVEAATEQQNSKPDHKPSEIVSETGAATADEAQKNGLTLNINNSEKVVEYNYAYGNENLTGTGFSVLILISAYVGLIIYFMRKYKIKHTNNSNKDE